VRTETAANIKKWKNSTKTDRKK